MREMPARTPESDAMSRALKKRGFTFVGSTICYSFMQATGMVNDHITTCFRHKEIVRAGTAECPVRPLVCPTKVGGPAHRSADHSFRNRTDRDFVIGALVE